MLFINVGYPPNENSTGVSIPFFDKIILFEYIELQVSFGHSSQIALDAMFLSINSPIFIDELPTVIGI